MIYQLIGASLVAVTQFQYPQTYPTSEAVQEATMFSDVIESVAEFSTGSVSSSYSPCPCPSCKLQMGAGGAEPRKGLFLRFRPFNFAQC